MWVWVGVGGCDGGWGRESGSDGGIESLSVSFTEARGEREGWGWEIRRK